MKTNKANFRKKAESISQMPSFGAWEKLDAKLGKAQPKKKTFRLYPLLAVAASFLLLFGLLFTNNFFSSSAENAIAKTASFTEVNLEQLDMQIALVYHDAGPYQSFYEKVAEARTNGLLEKYVR